VFFTAVMPVSIPYFLGMEEAEDNTVPISWKPLGAVVGKIVEGIREARLSQLVRETAGQRVTIGRNSEIATVAAGGCRGDLGDSEEKPRPKPGEVPARGGNGERRGVGHD